MGLVANPTLVCGDGPVAAALVASLTRLGRAVRQVGPRDLTRRRLGRATTLILADPADPLDLLDQVLALSVGRGSGRSPLHLTLAHLGACPQPLPEALAHPAASDRVQMEICALEARGARALLAAHPPHAGFDPLFGQVPHLLIVGATSPALALLGQAMRLAHYGEGRAQFTLAVDLPDTWRAEVLAAYPQAEQSCALRFTDLGAPDLAGTAAVNGVWVLVDPPETGLDLARALGAGVRQAQGVTPPIYLDVGAVAPMGGIDAWDGQLVPVSWLGAACRDLLAGQGDRLAQVIHEHYRDTTEAQGRDPALEPAGRPWELLDGSYRDASRYQADHLWAKLAATDCRTLPLAAAPAFAFAPLEVERLAQVEHRRWAADRHLNGWTYAPVRDNALRHHPQLIPYADLSEPMKDLDRFVVRLVPTLLARSGLAVVRGLVLGVAEADPATSGSAGRRTRRLVEACLGRLRERFPDRGLVLATTLADPFSRLVAARALDGFDAALWLLCHKPVTELLAAEPQAAARLDLLRLVARAERRIELPGRMGLEDWLQRRAQVLLLPGDAPAPAVPGRQVRVDPAGNGLSWGFEY